MLKISNVYMLGIAILLSACSTPAPESSVDIPVKDTISATPTEKVMVPTTVAGHYTGYTAQDNKDQANVDLWLREDSTFIYQRTFGGHHPQGVLGVWRMNGDLVVIDTPAGIQQWKRSSSGLELITKEQQNGYTIKKGEFGNVTEYPAMTLAGAYQYMADAQSFRPCGSKFNWPAAMGDGYSSNKDKETKKQEPLLERDYLKAVKTGGDPWYVDVLCRMVVAPAMEGDVDDLYVIIDAVRSELPEECD